MNNTQHTPTPWHISPFAGDKGDGNLSSICIAGHGQCAAVATFHKSKYMPSAEEQANAAFIVLAANNHDALVEKLEGITKAAATLDHLNHTGINPDGEAWSDLWNMKNEATALLDKIREEAAR